MVRQLKSPFHSISFYHPKFKCHTQFNLCLRLLVKYKILKQRARLLPQNIGRQTYFFWLLRSLQSCPHPPLFQLLRSLRSCLILPRCCLATSLPPIMVAFFKSEFYILQIRILYNAFPSQGGNDSSERWKEEKERLKNATLEERREVSSFESSNLKS